jgi:hypothetical protein
MPHIASVLRHRIAQAQELRRLGVRSDGDALVVLQEDGAGAQPRSSPTRFRIL